MFVSSQKNNRKFLTVEYHIKMINLYTYNIERNYSSALNQILYMYFSILLYFLYVMLYIVLRPCVTHSIPEITSVRQTTHTCTFTPGLLSFSPDFLISGCLRMALRRSSPSLGVVRDSCPYCTHILYTHATAYNMHMLYAIPLEDAVVRCTFLHAYNLTL